MSARLLVVLCLLLAGCASAEPDAAAPADAASAPAAAATGAPFGLLPSEGFVVSEVAFREGTRDIRMPVLVADQPELRMIGLMRREDLPDEAGMLFVYDTPDAGPYWMMNVTIPLSIAFVGQDGTVQQIMDMEPCAAEPCARYQPDDEYLYAVEANLGYFDSHDITPGWTMEITGEI